MFAELQAVSDARDAAKKALEDVNAKLGTVNDLEAQVTDLQTNRADLEAKIKTLVSTIPS
jgi:uncharacterized protein YoxC